MPRIRRVGNWLYAMLLGALSGRAVEDTASGMRVLRRDALPALYPLPDGLHFTPAMSARAVMNDLPIVEIPMTYEERVGRSKLSVLRDGVRFLRSIVDALLLYRPGRFFGLGALACLFVACVWGLYPVEFYLRHQRLEEWMIYRILLCGFLITCSCVLVSTGTFTERAMSLVLGRRRQTFAGLLIDRLMSPGRLAVAAAAAFVVGTVLVWPGIVEYVRSGHVSVHWSRVVVALLLYQLPLFAGIAIVQARIFELWRAQLSHQARSTNENGRGAAESPRRGDAEIG
jgi:hypothetical protein